MTIDEWGMDDEAECVHCKAILSIVRPGKYQCEYCGEEGIEGLKEHIDTMWELYNKQKYKIEFLLKKMGEELFHFSDELEEEFSEWRKTNE